MLYFGIVFHIVNLGHAFASIRFALAPSEMIISRDPTT